MKKRWLSLILIVVSVFLMVTPAFAATTELEYSVLHSTPAGFQNYNCYGYAIGTYQNIDPGYYSGRTYTCTREAIRENVIADLIALGYTNVRSVSSTYSLQPGEFMIAFTAGQWDSLYEGVVSSASSDDTVEPNSEMRAYHFWKKNTNGGYWYHKMGRLSSIMRLKSGYTPSTIEVTNEMHNGVTGEYSSAGSILRNATIIYIVYESSTSVNSLTG